MTWAVVYDLRLHTTSVPVNAGDVGTREKSCPCYKTAAKGMVPVDFLQLMLPQEILWKEKKEVLCPISALLGGERSCTVISALGTINFIDTNAYETGFVSCSL